MNENVTLKEDAIINRIYLIRGMKVMLDRDLADMYDVETRALNQAVKRNITRFPDDFMFQLTTSEMENWMSQIVISNREKMGLRKAPYAFTEQGVAMLSSVLKSEIAIAVNIEIIRVFTKMRNLISSNKDLLLKIEHIEKDVRNHSEQLKRHSDDIQLVFDALKALLKTDPEPRKRIGFKPD
jgi:hypothetical protein